MEQKYLRSKDIMALFGISRASLYYWRQNGLPYIGGGQMIFYELDKVTEWLNTRTGKDVEKAKTVLSI